MKFSQVLRTEREKRYYTIRQVCKILNIPLSSYHGWENGGSLLLNDKNFNYLKKIKEHYNLSWEYLFEGENRNQNLERAAFFISEYVRETHQKCSEV